MIYLIIAANSAFAFSPIDEQIKSTDITQDLPEKVILLQQQLNELTDGEAKVDLLNEISWETHRIDLDLSYDYAYQALSLSTRLGYHKGEARAQNLIAVVYDIKGFSDRSLELNLAGFETAKSINDSFLLSAFYNDIGISYLHDATKIDTGIIYLKRSIDYTAFSDTLALVFTYGNLGFAYSILGQNEEANKYSELSYEIGKESSDAKVKNIALSNKGYRFFELGETETADSIFNVVEQIALKDQDYLTLIQVNTYLGRSYLNKDQYQKSLKYYRRAYDLSVDNNIEQSYAPSLFNFAIYYNAINDYKEAEKYALLAIEHNYDFAQTDQYLEFLIDLYKENRDYKKLSEYQQKFIEHRDSTQRLSQQFTIRSLDQEFELNKERLSLEYQERNSLQEARAQKSISLFLLLSVIMLSIALYYMYNNYVEKKRTEKKLELQNQSLEKYIESNIELEQFAFIASHDLKTPLRTIGSFTTLLKNELKEKLTPKELSYLEYIEKDTKRMHNTVSDLLAYSKVNSQQLKIEPLSLSTITKKVIYTFNDQITQASATVLYNSPDIEIRMDESNLRILLQNLIENGLKYTPKDRLSCIEVKGYESKDFSFIKVTDNGIGIKKEFQEKIFESFTRLHTQDAYEGTGLGLSICKRIVDKHMGDIKVVNSDTNGTSIEISIPKALS